MAPLLSICIPTFNRARWVRACLEASLPQAEQFPGEVEVVVSDNASPDDTWAILQEFAAAHPCLRIHRNPENNYTENFNTVLREATGRYAWLMGDDDAPMPGAVARVLELLRTEPHDAYLLHAQEATLEEQPLGRREWLRPPLTRLSFNLSDPADFKAYLEQAQYMAAAFGFLSVLVVDRGAFLEGASAHAEFARLGWPHVANGLHMARHHGRLRVVPETLVWNRQQDSGPQTDPWGRVMHDLRGWVRLAETFFAEDPALKQAFLGVLRSNHDGRTAAMLRQLAPSPEAWVESREFLRRGGYSEREVGAAELGARLLQQQYPLSPGLEAGPSVLVDLPRFMRCARKAVVIALGPLDRFLEAQPLLSALHQRGLELRLLCQPELGELVGRFQVDELVVDRLYAEPALRAQVAARLRAWEPDLVLHADAHRDVAGDLLARESGGMAILAPAAGPRALPDEETAFLDAGFHALTPRGPGWAAAMVATLGLEAGPAGLWPGEEAEREVEALAEGLPQGPWVALLGDDPDCLRDEALPAALEAAASEGHILLGLGGPASGPALARLLAPFGDRACALAGSLSLGATVATLGRCRGHLGGGSAFGVLTHALGLRSLPLRALNPSR